MLPFVLYRVSDKKEEKHYSRFGKTFKNVFGQGVTMKMVGKEKRPMRIAVH